MKKIRKVLIANRGEIACRILRTLDTMGIPGSVVYHAVDADSPAVKLAPESIEIEGTIPVSAYLDVEQIIEACKRIGADALHPGFGFLAENAMFAERLAEEGITFIGPLPETMALMGDKIAARKFCMDNGFPIAPSIAESDAGEKLIDKALKMDFPLLVKAASGGGGKGMYIIRNADELEQSIQLAKGESLRAFGSDVIYLERYIENPRHIEVQIVADHHGEVIHLGERECSIQRRFQKIIEESPAPGLSKKLRDRICQTAVDIAREAGYRNAGTVEFILSPNNEFYFLEMNTRLQVEHPVTEMVTGIDLVEFQIRMAQEEALPLTQGQVKHQGHAIEVRLYAEDPEKEFIPATGELLAYEFPSGAGIRIENGYEKGMRVSSAFDPMLAKLITFDENREKAIEKSLHMLNDTLVLGVTTNADFLARILSHPEYKSGHVHTGFIPLHLEDLISQPLTQNQREVLLTAVALSSREFINPAFSIPEPYASIGNWRN